MKETQILFSGEMVRAIIEGRKTQTRRVIKRRDGEVPVDFHDGMFYFADGDACAMRCPYGDDPGLKDAAAEPGDRLWVRETWAWPGEEEVIYRADPDFAALVEKWKTDPNYPQIKWSPSIHMPRKFSRLTLEITKIRVERVQQISHEDATAEGCRPYCVAFDKLPAQEYRELWDKINAKRGFGWEANPWVWVIEFKEVKARKSA